MRKLFISVISLVIFIAATTNASAQSCSSYQPIDTQFRVNGGEWLNGIHITPLGLRPGAQIDFACFANNGTQALPGSVIDVTTPAGQIVRVANSSGYNGYSLTQSGSYSVRCSSQPSGCGDTDSFVVQPAASPTTHPTAQPTPTPTPTPAPTPTPTTPAQKSTCDSLKVVGGDNSLVPAKVTFRAKGSDNAGSIQRYKYYFGDGKQEETDNAEIQHTYESSGKFIARVDVKDSQGNWKTSSSCETTVTVKSSSIESQKSGCSDLYVTANNGARAPATLDFKITGFDNKGSLKAYKIEFGDDNNRESDSQTFQQYYPKAGSYTVRAYVKDSQDNWKGGEGSCRKTVYLTTKPLTSQPKTGTPTAFSLFGLGSGGVGITLAALKKRLSLQA